MKYIRTRDNIFEVFGGNKHTESSFCHLGHVFEVINQSDNIEDLLDETVAFYKDGTKFHWGTHPIEEVISFYRVNKNKEAELDFLGGYIWVCNNLMMVAKLTDKGWISLWGIH